MFGTRLIAVAMVLLAASAAAQPWQDWPAVTDADGVTVRTPDHDDVEGPRYQRIALADLADASGDPRADLEAALALMWLDMVEPRGEHVTDTAAALWGTVETEHGERELAARAGGGEVEVFVARRADFRRLGGEKMLAIAAPAMPARPAKTASKVPAPPPPPSVPTNRAQARPGAADTAMFPRALAPPPLTTGPDGNPPGWQFVGNDGFSPATGDKTAPHYYKFADIKTTGVRPTEAIRQAIKRAGLASPRFPRVEEIDKYPLLASNRMFITAGSARASGTEQAFIVTAHHEVQTGGWQIDLLHAKPPVLRSWDTALIMLHRLAALEDPRELAPATREAVSNASPAQQIDLIEFFVNRRVDALVDMAVGMAIQQQMAVNRQLMQFNQNLSTETDCIITSGCTISYDSLGNAQMTFD